MFYINVKINAKDKQSAIKYLNSLVGSDSYLKYNKENDIVTISDAEHHYDIINILGGYGKILKDGEKNDIDSFIDTAISKSSDIQELANVIYSKLGIKVRRSCDKRFASMISSFIESGKPVCNSTVEETVFSPNNFNTFAKACREKGFEPYEFIEKVCEKYINRENGEIDKDIESEKVTLDSFIDELISQSSDINKLAANIYRELGITVRRSCDKRFASMISSFIESGEPVCMSTIEETEFSPNNFKTLAKACADKGFEPFEFIGRVCEKYSAINKDIGDIKYVTQPIQAESQPIKPDDVEITVKDAQPETPAELEPITIAPKKIEPESDIVKNPVKPMAIKHTLSSLPNAQKEPAKRRYTPRRTNPNNFNELPAEEKMAKLRHNYNIAFKNMGLKKQVITVESIIDYLSTDALEILSIAVSEEPDIDKGKELIEAEARRKECGNVGYQIRQVYMRLKKLFEAKSDDYPVKDPGKTLHYFQQLCANQDTLSLMKMIAHNLVAQDRVDEAIRFCKEVDGKKNRTNVYTQQNKFTDSLIKELNSVPIAKMILKQIERKSDYSDTDFINTLEKTMERNNVKTGQIWLGRDETNQVDISLADVWYDRDLYITSFLQTMLKS